MSTYPFFQYRGKKSNDLNMRVRNEMEFVLPEMKLTFTDVDGRSSDIITSHGKYKDFTKTFPVRLYKEPDSSIPVQMREVASWLRLEPSYSPLLFSEYNEYYYMACGYSAVTAKDQVREWIDIDLDFKCQPYMFRRDGDIPIVIPNVGGIITNPEAYESLPIMKFKLTSTTVDGYFTINGKRFQIKAAAYAGGVGNLNEVTLDTANGIAYQDGGVNVSTAVLMGGGSYNLPVLQSGDNQISMGGLQGITIIPKWRVLAV